MALDTRVQDFPDWMQPRSSWTQQDVGQMIQLGLRQKAQRQEQALQMQQLMLRDKQTTLMNDIRLNQMMEAQAEMDDVPLLNSLSKDPTQTMPNFKSPKSFMAAGRILENHSKTQAGQAWHATQKSFWDKFSELGGDDQAIVNDMLRESKGNVTGDIFKYTGEAFERRPQQTAAITEAREVSRLKKEADNIRGTDPDKANEMLREAAQIEAKALGPQETIESYMDANGQPVFRVTKGGPAASGVTGVTRAKIEQSLRSTRESLDLMDQLSNDLRAKDLGFYGVVGENVMDRLLPQFGVKSLDPKRAENRTKLKEFVQGAVRQISPDNRFSNEDRQRVEALLPNTGVLENVEHAKTVISTIEEIFAKRNIRDMQQAKMAINPETLNNAEIVAAVQMGVIDKATGLKIIQSRP